MLEPLAVMFGGLLDVFQKVFIFTYLGSIVPNLGIQLIQLLLLFLNINKKCKNYY